MTPKFLLVLLSAWIVFLNSGHAQGEEANSELAAEVGKDAAAEEVAPVEAASANAEAVEAESLPDPISAEAPQMRFEAVEPVPVEPAPVETEAAVETEQTMELIPLPEGTEAVMEEDQAFVELPVEPSAADESTFPSPDMIPPPLDSADFDAPGGGVEKTQREILQEYKTLRIKIEKDPEVRSLANQAANARTDEEKRQARRAYYRLLFAKMRKAGEESLLPKIDTMEHAYLVALEQARLEPSLPLSPPPTPNP
ncbi:MAG: hypothetical protein ACK5LK_02770 [Chthoniobacterales bacterium]